MIDKNAANTQGVKLKAIEFVLWAEHIAYMNGGMTYHFDSPRNEYLTSIEEGVLLPESARWSDIQ